MLRKFLVPALLAAAIASGHAESLTPDQIEWQKGDASDSAWPVGDPKKPGACVQLLRWHPGHMSRPHASLKARYAVVLQGTWWLGHSEVYDPDATKPYPAGSVVTDLPGEIHYGGAKTEEVLIALYGDCPLATTAQAK